MLIKFNNLVILNTFIEHHIERGTFLYHDLSNCFDCTLHQKGRSFASDSFLCHRLFNFCHTTGTLQFIFRVNSLSRQVAHTSHISPHHSSFFFWRFFWIQCYILDFLSVTFWSAKPLHPLYMTCVCNVASLQYTMKPYRTCLFTPLMELRLIHIVTETSYTLCTRYFTWWQRLVTVIE